MSFHDATPEQLQATPERIRDPNWFEAFFYTPESSIAPWDVAEVIAAVDGENDENNWTGVFRLNDGRFLYLSAGCDYTGWDCQAGGLGLFSSTREGIIGLVPIDERERLELDTLMKPTTEVAP